eukprot:1145776-Pelagomonas_calceolata.AAC.5
MGCMRATLNPPKCTGQPWAFRNLECVGVPALGNLFGSGQFLCFKMFMNSFNTEYKDPGADLGPRDSNSRMGGASRTSTVVLGLVLLLGKCRVLCAGCAACVYWRELLWLECRGPTNVPVERNPACTRGSSSSLECSHSRSSPVTRPQLSIGLQPSLDLIVCARERACSGLAGPAGFLARGARGALLCFLRRASRVLVPLFRPCFHPRCFKKMPFTGPGST